MIGTALALLLLSGGAIPLWGGVLLAAVSAYTMLFLERLGVRYLEVVFQLFVAGGGRRAVAVPCHLLPACWLAARRAPAAQPAQLRRACTACTCTACPCPAVMSVSMGLLFFSVDIPYSQVAKGGWGGVDQ